MKPVVLSLCLVLLFVAGIVSGSLEDCPTCIYAYDSDGDLIADSNPYAGCPTCIFNYDSDGNFLTDTNPYAGCPTCFFNYDSNGTPITGTSTGCSSCGISSGTTNTLGTCTSCSFVSSVSRSEIVYRFPDGTPIPEDYLCPVHGLYCPDDPRPLEARPGYVSPTPAITPTLTSPSKVPDTSVTFSRAFSRASSGSRSDSLEAVLGRVSRHSR